uniref:C3H1-type domain-containing protein n=1 Tax=Leptocylindrus danicus TaxID=163516 RepID=A0A7S2KAR6_9STRA|mmetsp:Transcript_20653/g.30727  ORF Transcript_20653/g.30727 Transcript_20653/m.30727 type:complete len:577 (+) Transcript_20653:78-1808(+)
MTGSKKYKLFSTNSALANGEKPICAFYQSEQGCTKGDACKFSHGTTTSVQPKQQSNLKDDAASIISSESSSVPSDDDSSADGDLKIEDLKKFVKKRDAPSSSTPGAGTAGENAREKKKARRSNASTPFTKPPVKSSTPSAKPNPFLPPGSRPTTPSAAKEKGLASFTSPPSEKKKKKERTTKSSPAPTAATTPASVSNGTSSSFALNLGLPIVSFSVSGGVGASVSQKICDPKEVLPLSTQLGKKWKDLVQLTRSHPRYESSYRFSQTAEESDGWVRAKAFGSWCAAFPQSIAIDCEMCATKCPQTNTVNNSALCRLSVINGDNPSEVLIDTLVKPDWPVSDYRSRINGIKEEHLAEVQFTLKHAQEFMQALCSNETVIIGHAVHNDLEALKMEHYCCVDSAFILKVKDEEHSCPSLKDSAKTLFGKDMPEIHDSVNDARVSLECVEHYLEKEGKVDPIIRSVRSNDRHKLFIHRIPKVCTVEHISAMIQQYTFIVPSTVEPIEFSSNGYGKTYVVFESAKHSYLAFDTIKATARPDKTGKLQKRVYLRNSEYVQIRQMMKPRIAKSSRSDSGDEA